jgi:hypothetical protein
MKGVKGVDVEVESKKFVTRYIRCELNSLLYLDNKKLILVI